MALDWSDHSSWGDLASTVRHQELYYSDSGQVGAGDLVHFSAPAYHLCNYRIRHWQYTSISMKEGKVSGPSQANETTDPKWERVKKEVKSEIMPKHMPKVKVKTSKKPLSAFINKYC